jgi:hypothetical protein
MSRQPTIGQIVHVIARQRCRPAIVTGVRKGRLDLTVFDDLGPVGWLGIKANWHWPEPDPELGAERKAILGRLQAAAARIDALADAAADDPPADEQGDGAEPVTLVRRYQVTTPKDILEQARRRLERLGSRRTFDGLIRRDEMHRLIDWLNEEVPPA